MTRVTLNPSWIRGDGTIVSLVELQIYRERRFYHESYRSIQKDPSRPRLPLRTLSSLICSFALFIWSFQAFPNCNMSSFDWNSFINEPDAEVVANLAKGTREKVQEARGSFLRLASGALRPRKH